MKKLRGNGCLPWISDALPDTESISFIGLRTLTCRAGGESGRCLDSGVCEACRNSFRAIHQSTFTLAVLEKTAEMSGM